MSAYDCLFMFGMGVFFGLGWVLGRYHLRTRVARYDREGSAKQLAVIRGSKHVDIVIDTHHVLTLTSETAIQYIDAEAHP
jgi:hypothetical protein